MNSPDLEQVYHDLKLDILRYLTSLSGDAEVAQDLLQGVFLKLVEVFQQRTFSPDEIRPYVFRMAYNRYIDVYRKDRRQREYVRSVQADYQEGSAATDPRGGEVFRAVEEALVDAPLTERQRAIVELRVLGQYRIDEISRALGVARSTAYRELETSVKYLREALTAAGLSAADLDR